MSDIRRFQIRNGALAGSPLVDLWQIARTYRDPSIPNLPLETTPACVLTGTVTTAVASDIVAGGKTIVLTLAGETWVTSGATFNAQRANIIAGLDSAQSELLGWDNTVKALQGVAGVVRTSDTIVTITLDAQATYSITAPETITATIPATALTSGVALVAAPTFSIGTVAASEVFFAMLQRIQNGIVAQTAAGLGGVLVE